MLNKWIGIGNLVADPEVRYTQSGTAVANFKVACEDGYGEHKHTEYPRIVAFGKLAEVCGEYLAKGQKVYIEGPMKTRKWEDNSGNARYTTEITANKMIMLSRGKTGDTEDAMPPGEDDVPF